MPGERAPLIVDVQGGLQEYGPGIRTVVFFKGCPLSCSWCYEPEYMRPGLELAYDSRECTGCGSCISVCPLRALKRGRPGLVDRGKCTLCMVCTDACPSGALKRVGRMMKVEEVVAAVLEETGRYPASSGGATLSGGEPTLCMDFTSKLLQGLKKIDLHTVLETCGEFDHARFMKDIYPHLDLIHFDLRLYEPREHRRRCGVSNARIMDNFERLAWAAREGGVPVLPRIWIVPGVTDKSRNLETLARLLTENGARSVALRVRRIPDDFASCREPFSSFDLV